MKPARARALLEARAEALAARSPASGDAPAARSFMVFRLAGENWAVGLDLLRRVVPAEGIETVPGSPEGMAGIMIVGGRPETVWDLANLLGLERDGGPGSGHVLALRAGSGAAFLVDFVEGVRSLEAAPSPRPGDAAAGRFVAARTPEGICVLDFRALLAADPVRSPGIRIDS